MFNTKTRKIGKYVAQNIDPKQEREGTGLSVKGTTITGFKERRVYKKQLESPKKS